MGRPAKFSRTEAVETAMNIFWAKGYTAVSVSELAEAMNITRSSFYNCFDTKEVVFDEALKLYGQAAPDYFLTSLPEDSPALPALYKALRGFCRARAEDPDARGCMVLNSIAQAAEDNRTSPKLVAVLEEKILRYETLLKRAEETSEFMPITDAKTAAQIIVNHMMGINTMCKIVRSEDQLWALTETLLCGLGLQRPQ